MSRVFSFRLSEENPREKEALRILIDEREKGNSLRHLLTTAILSMDGRNSIKTPDIDETRLLRLIEGLLSQIPGPLLDKDIKEKNSLSSSFVATLKNSAKPGIKI